MFIYNHLGVAPPCDCAYIAPELRAAERKCNKCIARERYGVGKPVGVGAVSANVGVSASLLTLAVIGGLVWYFTRG